MLAHLIDPTISNSATNFGSLNLQTQESRHILQPWIRSGAYKYIEQIEKRTFLNSFIKELILLVLKTK